MYHDYAYDFDDYAHAHAYAYIMFMAVSWLWLYYYAFDYECVFVPEKSWGSHYYYDSLLQWFYDTMIS